MSDALSIASDLGFSVSLSPPPPSLPSSHADDDLIRVLRELTTVQRKIADLQVQLQGRKLIVCERKHLEVSTTLASSPFFNY
ncbi:hypothetical protein RIF29_15170 [Crotalaria pallida]|uniref:Uncharacterized protein n=1 Tax=Crotalaria pallida TaxID=3830 RepID=A0AAN9FD12_CROPI